MKSPDDVLMAKAISSQNLQNRASGNQQFASADFPSWVTELFSRYPTNKVLDICCGTGNQLAIFAKKPVNELSGIDISEQSIETAKSRLSDYQGKLSLTSSALESFLEKSTSSSFDFISCFYGLYYSSDINQTCQDIYRILQNNGHFLVCGPYGDNNKSLFSLLEKYYSLPEFVTYSSSTFMLQTLSPILESLSMTVEYEYLVNTISYPNADEVLSYLQSTTFFKEEFYDQIKNDLTLHFATHSSFDVEKHVMALIAKK